MGTTGAAMKAGGRFAVSASSGGHVGTGCRCRGCRPEPDWNGNRAQRRAAKKAGLIPPKRGSR